MKKAVEEIGKTMETKQKVYTNQKAGVMQDFEQQAMFEEIYKNQLDVKKDEDAEQKRQKQIEMKQREEERRRCKDYLLNFRKTRRGREKSICF